MNKFKLMQLAKYNEKKLGACAVDNAPIINLEIINPKGEKVFTMKDYTGSVNSIVTTDNWLLVGNGKIKINGLVCDMDGHELPLEHGDNLTFVLQSYANGGVFVANIKPDSTKQSESAIKRMKALEASTK